MGIIEKGTILNSRNNIMYPYKIKILNNQYLEKLVELQNDVTDKLLDPQMFYPLSLSEFKVILQGDGVVIGIFIDTELIGFRTLFFPKKRRENLGYDLSLKEAELQKVVHFETSCVHPNYRGNGIQQILGEFLLEQIIKESRFEHLCTTVYPENYASLKDKFLHQMVIKKLTVKYGGKIRYILYRNLKSTVILKKNSTVKILASDYKKQRELLQNGYYGYRLEKSDERTFVLFGKFIT